MRLPNLEISLPEWQDKDFRLVSEAEKKVSMLARSAGKGSDDFKNACRRLLEIVIRGDPSHLDELIVRAVDVRAFTYLLAASDDFAKSVSVSRDVLDRLLTPRSPLSKLSLVQMIRAFFVRYDTLVSVEAMEDWCEFIKGQLACIGTQPGSSDILRYAKYAGISFSPTGPSNVIAFAKANEMDFDGVLEKLGLTGFADGRFLTLCRYQYYLETLKSIPVGSDHPILSQVVKTDVVNAPFSEDRQLGHAILEVLIDRAEGQAISQLWQSTIMAIAGDPRVPKSSQNYQQWWSLLGEKRIALMRGWLSRFDLKLFLSVLEQSAKDNGNTGMERMFKPRKVFMEGLLEHRIVLESRLFLTPAAEDYIYKHHMEDELPSYARVKGGPASLIYLRLENGLHIVEGTHSFSIRVMNKIPSRIRLDDYSLGIYKSRDLGIGLGRSYILEYQSDGGLMETAHHPDLTWQNKVIEHLRKFKIDLDIGKLISPEKCREYKAKFGAN